MRRKGGEGVKKMGKNKRVREGKASDPSPPNLPKNTKNTKHKYITQKMEDEKWSSVSSSKRGEAEA